MRIPSEALSLYLSESDRKTFSDGKRAEPVDASARIGGSLSQSLPNHRHEQEADIEHDQAMRRGKSGAEERRQQERRRAKHPVLLDTRLTRHRRESGRDSTIDFEI